MDRAAGGDEMRAGPAHRVGRFHHLYPGLRVADQLAMDSGEILDEPVAVPLPAKSLEAQQGVASDTDGAHD
jgi:hypothetical protein